MPRNTAAQGRGSRGRRRGSVSAGARRGRRGAAPRGATSRTGKGRTPADGDVAVVKLPPHGVPRHPHGQDADHAHAVAEPQLRPVREQAVPALRQHLGLGLAQVALAEPGGVDLLLSASEGARGGGGGERGDGVRRAGRAGGAGRAVRGPVTILDASTSACFPDSVAAGFRSPLWRGNVLLNFLAGGRRREGARGSVEAGRRAGGAGAPHGGSGTRGGGVDTHRSSRSRCSS